MIRTIISFGWMGLSLCFFLPASLRAKSWKKKLTPGEYSKKVHKYVSWWARSLRAVSGARIHVEGTENVPADETVLYVSNHQSDFDIVAFLVASPLPIGFVAKIEMLKVPLLRTWMKHMQSIFIDRKDIRQTAKVILDGIQILKGGQSLVLFPEGTRNKGGEMLPFKAGGLKLATKSGAAVVPVTLDGSYKIIEENNYRITPADVYVKFHEPIRMDGLDAEELAALPGRVEKIIKDGLIR